MKKLLIILLIASLCMTALAGCGKKQADPDPTAAPTAAPTATPGTTEDTPQTDISNMQPEEYLDFDIATGTLKGFMPEIYGITDLVIPDQILGKDVLVIGKDAFASRGLNSVVLPANLVEIGNKSFFDNYLKTVDFPASVTTIGINAFLKNQLSEVSIPSGITVINIGVFRNNMLTSVEIPNTITLIKRGAFQENQLTSVSIPSSVKQIESHAFENNKLESVEFNEGLERIDGHSFEINNLTSITIPKSVLFIGKATDNVDPQRSYEKFVFAYNPLTEITMLGSNTEINSFLTGENNFFRDAYAEGGAGTYTGTTTSAWTKQ
ncbi:MAG: leucine-rich repeat domain-containing protein [Clostridia bacterium]|nr:leucine-rich repeat domain-containing protein [Clostridia bacterium]